jgi:hypothetical protein
MNKDYGVYQIKVSGYVTVTAGSPERAEDMASERFYKDFDGDFEVEEVKFIEQVTHRE